MRHVAIGVLGVLRLQIDGMPAAGVEGAVRRRLLALLAARRGVETRADWLADALWDGSARDASAATLQSHIAHLRRVIEGERPAGVAPTIVRTVPGGYLLAAEAVDVDADRFVALLRAAQHDSREGDSERALDALDSALAMVRGVPYEEFADVPALRPDIAALSELVQVASDLRLEVLERVGRFDELLLHSAEAAEAQPLREGPALALATALAATGRAPEALRTLHALRRRLAEATGLDASPAVSTLEQAILLPPAASSPGVDDRDTAGAPVRRSGLPRLRYAIAADGVSIAYQEVGRGPAFVAVPPLAQNIEICWQDDQHRRLIERAAERCRFVHFDKRGTGMSDRASEFTLEERLGDFLAVMDAAGVERAVVCGVSEAGPLAIAFAAAHPARVSGLYLVNTFARVVAAPDYPIGVTPDQYAAVTSAWEDSWGIDGGQILEWFAPSRRGDRAYEAWLGHYMRQSCSPGTLRAINRANGSIDVRHLLARLEVPTVVVHRVDDRVTPVAWGRYLAAHIPNATLHEVEGCDHLPWIGDTWREIIDGGVGLARAKG